MRTNPDSADAVGAISKKKAEIVLLGGASRPGLASAEPAFGREMLEEGDQATALIVIALIGRQGAGNRLGPPVMIYEAGIWNGARADLAQRARIAPLVRNDGLAVGDGRIRSIFLANEASLPRFVQDRFNIG